jgi:predicted DNA-binding transcriptional regulator YafY
VRADRLVSLVLLLRQHERLSAPVLARELEVSTRTVLRDVEALSAAGVPVYADRGRHGGFALLPGFRAELAGLNGDETLALLVSGSRYGAQAFGLGPAFRAAMLKVVDALPEGRRAVASEAAGRLLVEPEGDLLARRAVVEDVPGDVLGPVRRAVLDGRRLRLLYAAIDRPPAWRTVDPIGLVTVRGLGYLLATRSGADRTYRLSRIEAAVVLDEPARRPPAVDLRAVWRERSRQFRTGGDQVSVEVLLEAGRREELVGTALTVRDETVDADGRLRLEVTFQDRRHAVWALWQAGADAEVVQPRWLRVSLRERADKIVQRYAGTTER